MMKVSYIVIDPPNSFGGFDKFMAVLRKIKALGFHAVEFNLTQPPGYELQDLLTFVQDIDLPVAALLTGSHYFDKGLCMSSAKDSVRRRAVQCLQECVDIAAKFDAVLVVGQMQGFLTDEPDRHLGEERIEQCLKELATAADQHRTTVVLEQVNHLQTGFNNMVSDVIELTERIGSPYLKPMLDSFHLNIEEKSLTEPIHRVGKDLRHFHLCESNGGLPQSGHIDFKQIFAALDAIGYSGYVSVKTYREPWLVAAQSWAQYLKRENLM